MAPPARLPAQAVLDFVPIAATAEAVRVWPRLHRAHLRAAHEEHRRKRLGSNGKPMIDFSLLSNRAHAKVLIEGLKLASKMLADAQFDWIRVRNCSLAQMCRGVSNG